MTSANGAIQLPANDNLLQRFPLRRNHSEVLDSALTNVTGMPLGGGDLTFHRQTFGYGRLPCERITARGLVVVTHEQPCRRRQREDFLDRAIERRGVAAESSWRCSSVGHGSTSET